MLMIPSLLFFFASLQLIFSQRYIIGSFNEQVLTVFAFLLGSGDVDGEIGRVAGDFLAFGGGEGIDAEEGGYLSVFTKRKI